MFKRPGPVSHASARTYMLRHSSLRKTFQAGVGETDNRAFGGDPSLIAINARRTASEKRGQSGYANLVKGAFGRFRNPTAHEARIHWDMSKVDVEDLLTIVSLIHRRLDASHMLSWVLTAFPTGARARP